MVNWFREDTWFGKIVIARAKLVPVPNPASDFRIPVKHGASLHDRAEGLSLSVTNPNETISLVEN